MSVIQNLSTMKQMNYHELYLQMHDLGYHGRMWEAQGQTVRQYWRRKHALQILIPVPAPLCWSIIQISVGTLGTVPKISVPRQMIEGRGERECAMPSNPSLCPKAGLFISASAAPVSHLSNLFLKKWHRQFPPFLRQSLLGTGLHILGPQSCLSLQQFWGNAIHMLTCCG